MVAALEAGKAGILETASAGGENFMRSVILLCLAPLVLSACDPAQSQSTTDKVTWTMPNQRVDNTALPLNQIRETLISWGPTGGPYTQGSVAVAAPATSADIPRPQTPGTRCYVAQITDVGNLSSVMSNEVCKTINANPKTVTGLVVQ